MSRIRYLVLLPLFVILAFIEIYPLADTLYFSVTNYSQNGTYAGAANYVLAFTDPRVLSSIGVSLAYAVGSTLLCIGIGLVLTYLVTNLRKRRKFFESFFLMPLAVAPITVGVVWSPTGFWDDIDTFWHYVLHLPFFNVADVYLAFPIMILSDAWEWAPIIMLVALSVISGVLRKYSKPPRFTVLRPSKFSESRSPDYFEIACHAIHDRAEVYRQHEGFRNTLHLVDLDFPTKRGLAN